MPKETAVEDQQYDTPDAEEVYEAEPDPHVVPVRIEGTVRTSEMPTDTLWRHVLLPTGGGPQKVLNADPRRNQTILWAIPIGAGAEAVMFGSQADVLGNSGSVLPIDGNVPLRLETATKGELWAKGIVINDNGSGTFTGFGPSTDDALMSLGVEQWSD